MLADLHPLNKCLSVSRLRVVLQRLLLLLGDLFFPFLFSPVAVFQGGTGVLLVSLVVLRRRPRGISFGTEPLILLPLRHRFRNPGVSQHG